MIKISKSWFNLLKEEFNKEYYLKLSAFLDREYASKTVYPKAENIFNALNYVPYSQVKVVIIGQDPYHEPNQAHGLSFSVENGVALPPSLVNIFKEIQNEFGFKNVNGNLTSWAKQGVLLLNSVLTVRKGEANSHKNMGWEILTGKIIELLNLREEPIVFLLWGASAQKIGFNINANKHLVLKCAHPSPLSAYNGFFNCAHFIKTNQFLEKNNSKPIDWRT